ncbi:DUF3800 domain-containing protein [Microbacterium sp. GCS4]|uniref:DUF3800 domain-containing protein n=1 Tax=Microbacterium sp. GCS4 TaxID=1692239 RepID=UPI0006A3E6A2|nr:DUF3800 domain-containing protein [Microbacterium sp. GCS4]KNY04783.1 hypothetical protein AKH00_14990 [Microbacterium sp. GCS4]
MPALERMIYVDDSGRPQSGLVVFGWVEFSPDHWSIVLRTWLESRKRLWRTLGVPVSQELHTTDYVNGRGRISSRFPSSHRREGVELWKDLGREVAGDCLEAIRSSEGLRVGSVFRQGAPEDLADTRSSVYAELVARFEVELDAQDALGIIFMDGDGSDPTYRRAHRELRLDHRRVLEDAIHIDSRKSQFAQMADLVAWSAYASIERHPGNEFAWRWYESVLSERDPDRLPQEI